MDDDELRHHLERLGISGDDDSIRIDPDTGKVQKEHWYGNEDTGIVIDPETGKVQEEHWYGNEDTGVVIDPDTGKVQEEHWYGNEDVGVVIDRETGKVQEEHWYGNEDTGVVIDPTSGKVQEEHWYGREDYRPRAGSARAQASSSTSSGGSSGSGTSVSSASDGGSGSGGGGVTGGQDSSAGILGFLVVASLIGFGIYGVTHSDRPPAAPPQPVTTVVAPLSGWSRGVTFLQLTHPGGRLGISNNHELLLDGVTIASPLLYADRETPRDAYLSQPTRSGRYAFVSLCGSDWCDDARLIDLQRSQMVSIPAGKHSLPGQNVSWSSDEKYALLSWGHVEDQGFYVLDLGTLKMYDPSTPLRSLLQNGSTTSANGATSSSLNQYISAEVDTAEWQDSNRVRFSGHVWDTTHGFSVVGRIIGELAIPTLDVTLLTRWAADDDNGNSVEAVAEPGRTDAGDRRIAVHAVREGALRELYWVDEGVVAPKVVDREEYPQEFTDGAQGIIIVDVVVDQDGKPGGLRLLQGGRDDLGKARGVIEKWHFLPGSKNGVPVSVVATIELPRRITEDAVPVTDGLTSDTVPVAAYRVGGGVSAPRVLSKIEPTYTEEARTAKLQGTVVLSLVVDEHGVPERIKVIQSLDLGLDQKAIAAVQKWRFAPGTKGGVPVPVLATIEVTFRLL